MNRSSESALPGLAFIATIWALAEYTPFDIWSYPIAIAMFVMALAAYRSLGRAHLRLGAAGWSLTGQVAAWFLLFVLFFPAPLPLKILIVWGIGVPLVYMGAAARYLWERFPACRGMSEKALMPAVCASAIVATFLGWMRDFGLAASFFGALAIGAMAMIPLYYGWEYAKPLQSDERDARFGTEDGFRRAGMSDER